MYDINIEDGMVTLDGTPIGKLEQLLATLTKQTVSRAELDTCYAVAVALRKCCATYAAQKKADAEAVKTQAQADAEARAQAAEAQYAARAQELADEKARLADPFQWSPDDVEREAESNLQRALFVEAVKERTAEKLAEAGLLR